MIYGHEQILAALRKNLPPVCLFVGPPSVGKWAVAEQMRLEQGFLSSDVLRLHKLTAEGARDAVRFVQNAPAGARRCLIARVDFAAAGALNTLLKAIEEPGTAQIFLIAEQRVLPTIASRAAVYRFGRLTNEQVASVLVERNKMRPNEAAKLAQLGSGRIRETVVQLERAPDRNRVMTIVKSLRDRDTGLMETMADEWTEEATGLLREWCLEALTSRTAYFSSEEVSLAKIGRTLPLEILGYLAEDLRPRWIVRGGLVPLLRGA